jgi:hypothetical protein
MTFDIEVVLRDTDRAITEKVSHLAAARDWTDEHVRQVLRAILQAIDRAKNPDAPPREVTLRGFSWIVEPWHPDGGQSPEGAQVVIAVEIPTGAAVAGPFGIEQERLTRMITRVLTTASTVAAGQSIIH